MLTGQRFVISGLSRLTVRVARELRGRGGEVAVVASGPDPALATLLEDATLIEAGPKREPALLEAGLARATSLLALADDDLDNLAAAVAAHSAGPDVPVVLRAFDPSLIDAVGEGLNIRRTYSVSALAAPAFVAAAAGQEVVETLRLGDDEVPLCRMPVSPGSPLEGRSPAEVKREHACAVVARADRDGAWLPVTADDRPLHPGDQVLVGGRLLDVLRLALRNRDATITRATSHPVPHHRATPRRRRLRAPTTLLPMAALVLGLWLLATVAVFAVALDLNPIDAVYVAVTTALGNSTVDDEAAWLKVFGVGSMVAGGALLGVLFSWLASVATASRLDERMGRRARRLSDHVVIAGLGTAGFRTQQLLGELGVPVSIVERSAGNRFAEAVDPNVPVLVMDARLPENLEQVGIDDAWCFIACTDDDLTNVGACMQARRLHPGLHTVARIFDEDLSERVAGAFGVDAAVSTTKAAAGAFVAAAIDERVPRTIHLDGLELVAVRHRVSADVGTETLAAWRAEGIRLLAFLRDGQVRPASTLAGALRAGDQAIMAGPAEAVRRHLLGA
ncbi:MAG TPA: NAD(P)-binding protein [Actinomycetota bacterium]